jgi:outer membrane protein assembly factor BamA
MKKGFFVLISILLCTVIFGNIKAQNSMAKDTCCPQQDLVDLLFKGKNPLRKDANHRFRGIAVPVIGYDPTTSLQFGVGAAFSLQMGNSSTTNLSAGNLSILATPKHQYYSEFKANTYFPGNQWLLQSDWRFYIFNLPTYSPGTQNQNLLSIPTGFKTVIVNPDDGTPYNIAYKWLKFHNVFSRRFTKEIFCGVGYNLDYHYGIVDKDLKISHDTLFNTPNYSYSIKHGFNPQHYISSGVSVNFVYDSRDDMVNPYKGYFFNMNYRYNSTLLGSSANASVLWTEFRTYFGLSKKCPRHLLGFWYYGSYKISGVIPFLDLTSLSFDQMNSSGRGYAQGRFTGEDFVYGETEYRFPISPKTHILGGVLFLNATTASNRDMKIHLFDYLKPGYGAGLRIMVGKGDRTNIALDYGFGDHTRGFYIQAQEIF